MRISLSKKACTALCTWGVAVFYFLFIQLLRPIMIHSFSWALQETEKEENIYGFITWVDPGGFGFRFPTFYRVFHNLTVPYIMFLYVIAFVILFLLSRNKIFTVRGHMLFCCFCMFVHVLFFVSYAISTFLPYEVFGSYLG